MKQLLKAGDVAKILGITTGKVYQMKAQHKIPYITIDGSLRFDEDAISEWIKSNTHEE